MTNSYTGTVQINNQGQILAETLHGTGTEATYIPNNASEEQSQQQQALGNEPGKAPTLNNNSITGSEKRNSLYEVEQRDDLDKTEKELNDGSGVALNI